MATSVIEAKNPSSLRIKFDCGLGDNGRSIIKSRTYSNVKPTATPLRISIVHYHTIVATLITF